MFRYLIRPAQLSDLGDLFRLARSLSAQGFLTLPAEQPALLDLMRLSERSFAGAIADRDEGRYLLALRDLEAGRTVGSSQVIARHGTPTMPHLYFQVDRQAETLTLHAETTGRTELGGLILDPAYRKDPARLGKWLSLTRLFYIARHPGRFLPDLIAEFLPPFAKDGSSPFWDSLGRQYTGMSYEEADRRSRQDNRFVVEMFPKDPISFEALHEGARAVLGRVGPETEPAIRILTEMGLRYLDQVDPFDGGPHYGARQDEIRQDLVSQFLLDNSRVELQIP